MNTMKDAMLKAGIIKSVPEKDFPIYPGKKTVEIFKKANSEKPMFAEIEILKEDIENNYEIISEWKGLVACTGMKEIMIEDDYGYTRPEKHAQFRAIEDGEEIHKVRYGYHIKRSVGFPGTEGNFIIHNLLETTPELINQYKKCIEDITVTVTYRDYMEEADRFGCIVDIPGTERTEIIPNIHSIDEGIKWMLQNHPGQYVGMCLSTSSGDFYIGANPCIEYGEGKYETRKNREIYAIEEAIRLGVEIDKFDYTLADEILSSQMDISDEMEYETML